MINALSPARCGLIVVALFTIDLSAAQNGPTREASALLESSPSRSVPAVIEDYVRAGLASNLALQSASLEVERSQAALDAARGKFFPEAAIASRYTRAEGGREVSLPIGSALNPVYLTLNELLLADGKAPRFGTIEDPRFLLQREEEQDTRLSIRQPLSARGERVCSAGAHRQTPTRYHGWISRLATFESRREPDRSEP